MCATPRLVSAVISRMSETTIARFVAHNVIENTPIDRLAQAFQTLVRDGEQRQRMLALAHADVAASPLGQTDGFDTNLAVCTSSPSSALPPLFRAGIRHRAVMGDPPAPPGESA